MFTTGAKFFYSVAAVAFFAALGYAWTTGGNGLGPLTFGYKGSVGDHLGYTVLMGGAAVAMFLGLVTSAFRDADPRAVAEVAGTEVPPAVTPPRVSYWPVLAAFSVGMMVLGLVISNVMFVIGLVAAGIVMVEWLVLAWSERATGDPATNRAIRARLMGPIELPFGSALVILFVVVAMSRVFLAASALGAVAAASVIALLVLGGGVLVAERPRLSSNAVALLLFIGAVGVLTAGVIGAASGEREFHPHENESGAAVVTDDQSDTTEPADEEPSAEDESGDAEKEPAGEGN